MHAERRASGHVAVIQEVIDLLDHAVDGDRKPEPFGARIGDLGVDDADEPSRRVKEPAARIARADGGVRLHKLHFRAFDRNVAPDRRNHAAGRRAAQFAQRVADRDHVLADGQHIAVAEGGGGQPGRVDLDDRKVVALVRADQRRFIGGVVVQRDGQLFRTVHDVRAGGDIAVRGDDHAAAAARLLIGLRPSPVGNGRFKDAVDADDARRAKLHDLRAGVRSFVDEARRGGNRVGLLRLRRLGGRLGLLHFDRLRDRRRRGKLRRLRAVVLHRAVHQDHARKQSDHHRHRRTGDQYRHADAAFCAFRLFIFHKKPPIFLFTTQYIRRL